MQMSHPIGEVLCNTFTLCALPYMHCLGLCPLLPPLFASLTEAPPLSLYSNVSPALSETIMTMVSNAQVVLNKARQQQQQNAQQQGPPPIRTAAPPPPQGTLPGLPNPMDPLGLGVAAGLAPSSTSAFLAANSTPTSGFPVVPPSTTAFPGGLPQTPSSSAFSAPFQGVPPMSSGGSSLANTFPGNVPAHTATPGSPSKSFGGLGLNTQAPQGFSMQSITSQIQGQYFVTSWFPINIQLQLFHYTYSLCGFQILFGWYL